MGKGSTMPRRRFSFRSLTVLGFQGTQYHPLKMHTYQQPRILRINLLDMALVDYEKLTDVTVTLCRLDLNEPKPVILKIDLTSDPSLLRLLEKVSIIL